MRMRFVLFMFALLPLAAIARSVEVPTLAPSAFADTESVTNVVFDAGLNVLERFAVTLSCHATASNNVEVAFGTDSNMSGELELDEIDWVVGWDSGSWFTRRRADGEYISDSTSSTNEFRTLSMEITIRSCGLPSQLLADVDGLPVFVGLRIDSFYNASWNMLRLTSRGEAMPLGIVSVSTRQYGTLIIVK